MTLVNCLVSEKTMWIKLTALYIKTISKYPQNQTLEFHIYFTIRPTVLLRLQRFILLWDEGVVTIRN